MSLITLSRSRHVTLTKPGLGTREETKCRRCQDRKGDRPHSASKKLILTLSRGVSAFYCDVHRGQVSERWAWRIYVIVVALKTTSAVWSSSQVFIQDEEQTDAGYFVLLGFFFSGSALWCSSRREPISIWLVKLQYVLLALWAPYNRQKLSGVWLMVEEGLLEWHNMTALV